MAAIDGALLDFKRLDRFAMGNTLVHRLDPRAKVAATLAFIVAVISFGRYELTGLVPFFIFPVAMAALGNLPFGYLIKKIVLICPFILMVGLFNPLFDHGVLIHLGPLEITGGWISFASIMVKAVLTVGSALVLICVTGFSDICRALECFGVPRAFVVQLLFLYRYIFVLTDEGVRVSRARQFRSFDGKGPGMKTYGAMLGHLLLRTWQRAERIHMAMLSRGFSGEFHTRRTFRLGKRDVLYLLACCAVFITLRLHNAAQLLGSVVTGIFS
jgi:cobalt/nickel transport system permease protein